MLYELCQEKFNFLSFQIHDFHIKDYLVKKNFFDKNKMPDIPLKGWVKEVE